MVIAQVLPCMRRAGAESAVANLCRGLANAGEEAHLVVVGGAFDYGEELKGTEVQVHYFRLFQGSIPFYRRDIHRKIKKYLSSFLGDLHPDILHCQLGHALIWSSPAIVKWNLKTFYTFHGISPFLDSKNIRTWWRTRIFLQAVATSRCHMFAVSQSTARYIENALKLKPYSIPILPNPIDLARWKSNPKPEALNHLRIIMVGTLDPIKNIDIGIQAMKILALNYPTATLDIVGDGYQRGDLEQLVETLGLKTQVSFMGVRTDIPDLLREADIMWLLSTKEGMPMVVIEAMASGLPIIATNVMGINELIRDGENGLLVPLGNPQAVAAATVCLSENAQLYERLKEKAFSCVSQFSLENTVRQHLDYYADFSAQSK